MWCPEEPPAHMAPEGGSLGDTASMASLGTPRGARGWGLSSQASAGGILFQAGQPAAGGVVYVPGDYLLRDTLLYLSQCQHARKQQNLSKPQFTQLVTRSCS